MVDSLPVGSEPPRIAVSVVLSIHNRSTLFARAIEGYLAQTMPPDKWEIILVDDMSTEDLSEVYKPYAGRMNLRHVKMDHTRHPIWKERHPRGASDTFENWFHTPSISINMGCHLARGKVICLCHPEILHNPDNFEHARSRLGCKEEFLFGKTFLGTRKHNEWLSEIEWSKRPWNDFLAGASRVDTLTPFLPTELYWYTSFLPRQAVLEVGGVDFTYLNGTCAEDDDFRERVTRAGRPALWYPQIQGFHQDHSDEKEYHRNRNTKKWERAMARNRSVYAQRKKSAVYPKPANADVDWTGMECFVEETGISYDRKLAENRNSR